MLAATSNATASAPFEDRVHIATDANTLGRERTRSGLPEFRRCG
jgi:hypothetical protein